MHTDITTRRPEACQCVASDIHNFISYEHLKPSTSAHACTPLPPWPSTHCAIFSAVSSPNSSLHLLISSATTRASLDFCECTPEEFDNVIVIFLATSGSASWCIVVSGAWSYCGFCTSRLWRKHQRETTAGLVIKSSAEGMIGLQSFAFTVLLTLVSFFLPSCEQ